MLLDIIPRPLAYTFIKGLKIMISVTAKITKKRIFCAALAIIIPLMIILAININSSGDSSVDTAAKTSGERLNFLSQFGWQCDESAETVKDSVIPEKFDDVYVKYNEIQTQQGFSLEKYKGKSVKIYTEKVLNYPENSENVYATLMVYDGKIIGGDIHSTALDGFMHGFDLSGTGLKFGQKTTAK